LARTGLLEKAPHPRNYEYRFAPHGALDPSKGAELSSLLEEGCRPVGIVYFSHAIGAATKEMFFEHEVGQSAYASHLPPGSEIQVADAMRVGNVMKRVHELAKQGYRFLSPHDSNKHRSTIHVYLCTSLFMYLLRRDAPRRRPAAALRLAA
jgi:hypothetical protein